MRGVMLDPRPIKFRAWFKPQRVMLKSMLLKNTDFLGGDLATIDPQIILLQFTGLTDKNGREIYEGDIVVDDFGQVFKSVFVKGMFCWEGVENPAYPTVMDAGWLKVIGNIYENPELLSPSPARAQEAR